MAYNIFFDINILVDFFLPHRKEHELAVKLVDAAEKGIIKIALSESVINTTFYLVRKSVHINLFNVAMMEINTFAKVLPCSNVIIEEAYKNAKNDLEDAVLYQIALSGKMDYFITHDRKHLKKIEQRSLPVISSKEMIGILNP